MDFRFSDEQRMLDDSTVKFLAGRHSFDKYRAQIAGKEPFDSTRWNEMVELGWMSLPFPESVGGFGGSLVDVSIVARRLGGALCIDPWLTTVILPGKLLEYAESANATKLLTTLADGTHRAAAALLEPGNHYHLKPRTAVLKNGRLSGSKSVVLGAETSQLLIVSALNDKGATVLVAVPARAAGVQIKNYRVLDGSRAAEIVFKDVPVAAIDLLAEGAAATDAISRAVDYVSAAWCAEMVGSAAAVFDKTVAYARTRKQFGVAIGSFQVLQHYMVDMLVELQQAESLMLMAAVKGELPQRKEREIAISTARAYLAKSAVFIAQKAIQIHGGIGVTEELDIGHHFRRVTHLAALFGDRDFHLNRYMTHMD